MAIIDGTTDIKEFLSVNRNLSYETLKPYIDNALVEFIETPWLGADIIQDVESNLVNPQGIYEQLIPMLQRSLTYFSVLSALPFLEVNIGDEGITRTESQNFKSAYRGQVARIEQQLKKDAYNSLERLLNFLEKEKANYPLWVDAPGYVEFSNYFFKDSVDFSKFYPLKNGRLTYNSLLPGMRFVTEFKIKSEIGELQFADFFAKKLLPANSSFEVIALGYLRNAIAYLTVARSIADGLVSYSENGIHFSEQTADLETQKQSDADFINAKIIEIETRGTTYLSKLVDYMNANLDEFTVFRDDDSITKSNTDFTRSVGDAGGIFGV